MPFTYIFAYLYSYVCKILEMELTVQRMCTSKF